MFISMGMSDIEIPYREICLGRLYEKLTRSICPNVFESNKLFGGRKQPRLVSGYVCCLKSLLAHFTLNICYLKKTILQFCSVTWPLNGSEAGGGLVLIQTSLFFLCKSSCSNGKSREVWIKPRSPPDSLRFKRQVTEQTTVKLCFVT